MQEQQSSYRQIVKTTSVFGGVQVFNIIISILKYKVIAILLGTNGVGLFGLFNSTIDVFRGIAGLGISQSAVKEVSQAYNSNDEQKISITTTTIKRWLYFTGIIGTIIFALLSKQLSKWTFGHDEYTWSFVWLSIVIFFSLLSSGQMAVLQGARKIKSLVKVNLLSAIIGLGISIPLYYYLGNTGVVVSIIISAILVWAFSAFYIRGLKLAYVTQSIRETIFHGTPIVKLGLAMMFSSTITLLTAYFFRTYLYAEGGLNDVGIFQSGFSIIEGYMGLIFTAMATDYYPRLAAISSDNKKIEELVNRQSEIGLLIIMPMVVIALFFMPLLIELLYTKSFLAATPYVKWALLGVILKVGSFANGYVLFAKGKSNIFIWTAIGFNILILTMNIIGYNTFGIEGIGIAYAVLYAIHFITMLIINRSAFGINFGIYFWKLLSITLLIALAALSCQWIEIIWIRYGTGTIITIFASLYAFREADKLLDLKHIIKKLIKR